MPSLYQVKPGSKRDTLTLDEVWSGKSPLDAGYKQIVPIEVAGQSYLFAFDDKGEGSAFRATTGAPWIEPVASKLSLGGAMTNVEPFILGMAPYLLAYEATGGNFAYFPIGSDLSTQLPYNFKRTRVPATQNYTVTEAVVINDLLYIVCYSFTTGEVDIWSLQVTVGPQPGSKPGTPSLLQLPVWIHQWAKNWTKFAFFYMGAELFFFKINVGKVNVNIDHILDDPSQGSVEVGTYMQDQLDDPKNIDIVEPFTMGGGEPHFVTYLKSGKTQCFRIHADCQGWTKQAELETEKNASIVVPYQIGEERFMLFY